MLHSAMAAERPGPRRVRAPRDEKSSLFPLFDSHRIDSGAANWFRARAPILQFDKVVAPEQHITRVSHCVSAKAETALQT